MDHDKVTEFLGQFVTDLGATGAAGSVVIGHRLGLYRALAQGPATPEQFAERTGCHPRYLTEWLRGQAAGGYVELRPGDRRVLADRGAGVLPGRPERPERAGGVPHRRWAICAPNRRSPRRSAPAPASPGTSTTRTSSSAATRSTGPATWPSWCRTGSRRWTGSRRS